MFVRFNRTSEYNRIAQLPCSAIIGASLFTGLWALYQCLVAASVEWCWLSQSLALFSFTIVLCGMHRIYFNLVKEKNRETAELSRLHLATVEALATAIDAKDQTTHYHVRRVQIYAAGMGRLLDLSGSEIEALKAGALLHDIGKLAVPSHILNKSGELTASEFEKMKIHTTIGAQILERVEFPYPVVPIVRHHHEQWNGEGYPDKLRGEQIPLTVRILAVVDCYDTVREDRPYRRGMSRDEAITLLERSAGTHFDPRIVELFVRHLPQFEAEVANSNLDEHSLAGEQLKPHDLVITHTSAQSPRTTAFAAVSTRTYLDQIKDAHSEVYALYEMASSLGGSLDVADAAAILVGKVGHIVPFDTCAVYLYDELRGCATATQVAGQYADALRGRTATPEDEDVVGFALANPRPATQFDPTFDATAVSLMTDGKYRSAIALPLVKDERLLGAVVVYSAEPNRYTDDHRRLLDSVVRLASDAFANAIDHAEAESNALTDALTGLPNARAFHLRFEEEAARTARTERPFQIVMLDLDDFKQVNDTFGHKTGDQVLREVAGILQAQLREYDFLARYAGDEFIAIVQDLSDEQVNDLHQRIERAIKKFSVHVQADKHARVGISVGAATYGIHGTTFDQLLVAADEEMYSAKSDHKKQAKYLAHVGAQVLASPAVN